MEQVSLVYNGFELVNKRTPKHEFLDVTKRKFVVTTDSRHYLPVVPDVVHAASTLRRPAHCGPETTYVVTEEGWL